MSGASLKGVLAGLWLLLAAPPALAAETMNYASNNTPALAHFRAGRYAAAYAAFRPALKRGDPEAVFHGLIIRRNGLDGGPPAKNKELAALTGRLAARAEFMRQAVIEGELQETTADAYRTALALLIYSGEIPLENPPDWPSDYPDRRRKEALEMISYNWEAAPPSDEEIYAGRPKRHLTSSRWVGAPIERYPPAQNFAAYLNLAPGGSPAKALAHMRKSAAAGDRLGMINLSLLYREGWGGVRDDLKAAHLARRAADAKPPIPRAVNEVGYFYETGRGVTRDWAEARTWYEKSAALGSRPGRKNAARLKAARTRDPGRPALDETILF